VWCDLFDLMLKGQKDKKKKADSLKLSQSLSRGADIFLSGKNTGKSATSIAVFRHLVPLLALDRYNSWGFAISFSSLMCITCQKYNFPLG